MMPLRKRAGCRLLVIIFVAVVMAMMSYILWLWATYIDDIVESGGAYSLTIGQSKREVFASLPSAVLAADKEMGSAYIVLRTDARLADRMGVPVGYRAMIPLSPDAGEMAHLLKDNQWDIYFDRDYNNFLRLTFCDGFLCKIYRHRQHFELP